MQRKANCRPLITSVSIVDRKESKEMKPQIFGSRKKKKKDETQDIEREKDVEMSEIEKGVVIIPWKGEEERKRTVRERREK